MALLYHHTTRYVLEGILEEGLLPMFDYVWLTAVDDGETTAGLHMGDEHRARISIEYKNIPNIEYVHDHIDDLPHLNFGLLNMITDTSSWYFTLDKIEVNDFNSIEVIKDGKWVKYEPKKETNE